MTAGPLEDLVHALRRGVEIIWAEPPRLAGPERLIAPLKQRPELIRAVLHRGFLFRAQIVRPGPVPLLILPGVDDAPPGCCLSCGASLDDAALFRCPLCQVAAWLALDLVPPEPGSSQ